MSITFYAGFEPYPNRWDFVREGINVNDSNGAAILRALNLNPSDDGGLAPMAIDAFTDRCTAALRNFMRQPDPGAPWVEFDGAKGARFVDCGRDGSYLPERISQLSRMAREGRAVGATHIYAA